MKKVLIVFILTSFLGTVFADTVDERVELARINSVLNAVYPLIDAAQKAAPTNARETFHYDWLRSDIQSIQAGIAERINKTPIEPRVVTLLKTHYVQLNDKVSH